MAPGLVGQHGHLAQQRVERQRSIVSCRLLPIFRCLFLFFSSGTRNCTGAANGGVCLGTALDTQLCDTNVSCLRK